MSAASENGGPGPLQERPGVVLKAEAVGRFLVYAGQRFIADGGPAQAAGLSYASLLAVVPLLAVGLSFLAGFPAF